VCFWKINKYSFFLSFLLLTSWKRLSRHRKKTFLIFPSPAGMSLTKLSLGGNNDVIYKLFPPRESLASDIQAGAGWGREYRKAFFTLYTLAYQGMPFLKDESQSELSSMSSVSPMLSWSPSTSCRKIRRFSILNIERQQESHDKLQKPKILLHLGYCSCKKIYCDNVVFLCQLS
jgi:hypothetical protein